MIRLCLYKCYIYLLIKLSALCIVKWGSSVSVKFLMRKYSPVLKPYHCDSRSQWPLSPYPPTVCTDCIACGPERWLKHHPSFHPIQGQLYYKPEICLKENRPAAHSWLCVLAKMFLIIQHAACSLTLLFFHFLPAPNPNDTFGLICKAYSVIHLRCYGGKKRFMAHNKLLRSCMWWGNQGRKWGGNSLLHATLIHPSVRETSPLCTPHLKRP